MVEMSTLWKYEKRDEGGRMRLFTQIAHSVLRVEGTDWKKEVYDMRV